MSTRIAAALSLATALATVPSVAGASPHDGLLVRFTPGFSGAAAASTIDDSDYSISGAAGRLGVAVGYAVAPRFILTGELVGHTVFGPELEVDGDATGATRDVTWSTSYLGLGASYYLPSNFYFAGSLGPLIMMLETDRMESETDLGGAAKLTVGKEWWVSPDWGLGMAFELLGGAVPDGDADWTVATLGLAFSATYN